MNNHWKQFLWTWWRHQMESFSALLAICAGNSPVPVKSPHKGQWRGALIFFYLRLNKRLSKQPWGWWFETPSWSLWRQCNELGGSRHPHVPGRLMASKPNICWHRSWCTSSYKSRKMCGAWRWQCHLVDDVAVSISWLNNWVCGLLGTLRGMRMGYIQYFLFLVHWNILLKP